MEAEELAARWREMSPEEREEAYSPSSSIGGDYSQFIAAYRDSSAEVRSSLSGWTEFSYGPTSSQCLDLFMPVDADGPVPLVVFIHGGYWQELSKDDSSFPAPAWVDRGVAFAALDYTLAPEASLAEIVAECRRAVGWIYENAGDLGIDPRRIVVAGSSAGAHLAAMVAVPGWQQGVGIPGNLVAATVLMSGIFDLEPLVGTLIAEPLCLTDLDVTGLSPARLPLDGFPPSVICWGEVETDEFKAQSGMFDGLLAAAGTEVSSFEVPDRNHFDVVFELADTGSRTGRALASILGQLEEA